MNKTHFRLQSKNKLTAVVCCIPVCSILLTICRLWVKAGVLDAGVTTGKKREIMR